MEEFSLGAVYGAGSPLQSHFRYPLCAFQAGCSLVLWDYVKSKRHLIPLSPDTKLRVFFSQDAAHLFGIPLRGAPTLAIWKVVDGEKIHESRLADVASERILVDHNPHTSLFVMAQADVVGQVSVIHWDPTTHKIRTLAHGHCGESNELISVKLIDQKRFCLLHPTELKFWIFSFQTPRLESQIVLKQQMVDMDVCGQFVYLLTKKGRLLCLDLEGKLVALVKVPSVAFTCMSVDSSLVVCGTHVGDLYVYATAKLDLVRKISGLSAPMRSVCFGMAADYIMVTFAGGYGVVHVPSSQYVALRRGHDHAIRHIAVAPSGDFLSLDSASAAMLTWQKTTHGSATHQPFAWTLRRAPRPPEMESFVPTLIAPSKEDPRGGEEQRLHMAEFYANGQIVAGAEDGAVYLMDLEHVRQQPHLQQLQQHHEPQHEWVPVRVRPLCAEASYCDPVTRTETKEETVATLCHCAFWRNCCLLSFSTGYVELVTFPELTRLAVVQRPFASRWHGRSWFVCHPLESKRIYDTNIYVLCPTDREVVLYEFFTIGTVFAKSVVTTFVMSDDGTYGSNAWDLADCLVHPSQQFLVCLGRCAARAKPQLFVFDIWQHTFLARMELFASPLTETRAPLIAMDRAGMHVFASFSAALGIWDFNTGRLLYQISLEVSTFSMTPDMQLLIGAEDGTLVIYRSPKHVSDSVSASLADAQRLYTKQLALRGATAPSIVCPAAVELLWAGRTIQWSHWGDDGTTARQPSQHLRRRAEPCDSPSRGPLVATENAAAAAPWGTDEDVVVLSRQRAPLGDDKTLDLNACVGGGADGQWGARWGEMDRGARGDTRPLATIGGPHMRSSIDALSVASSQQLSATHRRMEDDNGNAHLVVGAPELKDPTFQIDEDAFGVVCEVFDDIDAFDARLSVGEFPSFRGKSKFDHLAVKPELLHAHSPKPVA
eukprot:GEMP01008699.1.p1 GENE.GEMP01008699.1~~GEMP01008699.1.p1  ORF type:complete len:939 (+),score=244.16 GEMP01008699.1:55-2871(+)